MNSKVEVPVSGRLTDARSDHCKSAASDDCCDAKADALSALAHRKNQRGVLITVLILNLAMFFAEFGAGVVAGSAALMADAVDMLGDALVYGLSLYALSRSERWKAGAAVAKGGVILMLGIGVFVEAISRITTGAPPSSALMLTFGALALCVNGICLSLLWRFRGEDVNMASTFECSRNDVIANGGVLAAAGAVALLRSPWPDVVVGLAIATVFVRSAFRVLRRAVPMLRTQ